MHPLVLLSVADHHGRALSRGSSKRVIGVLLGQDTGKTINVANSFGIPFEEDEKDPKTWFLLLKAAAAPGPHSSSVSLALLSCRRIGERPSQGEGYSRRVRAEFVRADSVGARVAHFVLPQSVSGSSGCLEIRGLLEEAARQAAPGRTR